MAWGSCNRAGRSSSWPGSSYGAGPAPVVQPRGPPAVRLRLLGYVGLRPSRPGPAHRAAGAVGHLHPAGISRAAGGAVLDLRAQAGGGVGAARAPRRSAGAADLRARAAGAGDGAGAGGGGRGGDLPAARLLRRVPADRGPLRGAGAPQHVARLQERGVRARWLPAGGAVRPGAGGGGYRARQRAPDAADRGWPCRGSRGPSDVGASHWRWPRWRRRCRSSS